MEISAEANQVSVADFTNHVYFNLDGENYGNTADHTIMLDSGQITDTDQFLLPAGKIIEVAGTDFELRQGKNSVTFLWSMTADWTATSFYPPGITITGKMLRLLQPGIPGSKCSYIPAVQESVLYGTLSQ